MKNDSIKNEKSKSIKDIISDNFDAKVNDDDNFDHIFDSFLSSEIRSKSIEHRSASMIGDDGIECEYTVKKPTLFDTTFGIPNAAKT